jgi:uncharacterized protein (DUF2236 family)
MTSNKCNARFLAQAPGPGSILWDIYSDLALGPFAAAILVMQAAHPDVGAAVAKYSVYQQDPWGRLFRTGFSMMRFLYGGKKGQQSEQEVKELRGLHAHIKGTRPDGTPYHALDPHCFRVVPDTFLDGAIRFRGVLGKPLNKNEKEQLYREYVNLCLLFGIPKQALESDIESFSNYYADLLLNTMTFNETVSFLLGDMMRFGPKIKYLPLPINWWHAIYKRTVYPITRTFTLGFLDSRFREKHNISWTHLDERRYQRWLTVLRFLVRWTPRWLRYSPFALYIMAGGHGPRVMDIKRLTKMLSNTDDNKNLFS